MNGSLLTAQCRRRASTVILMALMLVGAREVCGAQPDSNRASRGTGTFERLFAADSLWNSRPVDPTLGADVIPKSDYFPNVAAGAWSTGLFLAKPDDQPMHIHGLPGKAGVWDVDAEQFRDVTVPRWPADLAPASEADGHADIVDPVLGIVQSFWQLKKVDDQWIAGLYAWTPLKGRGWGDPAHYYQGARAAAVPAAAGLMRKHEINDGDTMYRHALAISLTYNALSANPAYIFPATSADGDASTTNTGKIPEGALLMLPPSFEAQRLATPELRKVAETLKVFGGYVVDRNVGTPFMIYVEIGAHFRLHKTGWNNATASDLDHIRESLRQVVATKGWVDADDRAFTPRKDLNLLSMRGPWRLQSGPAAGSFETLRQAVVFPATQQRTVQMNDSGRSMQPVSWAIPVVGKVYRLHATTTGGARLRVALRDKTGGAPLYDSGELGDGEARTFKWPANAGAVVYAISGTSGPSTVGGDLVAVDEIH
ncbi:MAG: Atrophin-1 multi-domain protein [Burkholderiaceae bacterium]